MTEGVKTFLTELGMIKYYDMFKIKGFDDESDIPYLTTFDLYDTIMVTDQLDRATILSHARLYRPSSEHAVYAWLSSNSLSYYFIGFLQSELTDLGKIAQLSLPNEDLYDELEIMLPGHRKRFERAVQRLKLEQVNDATAEAPVLHGWWGKPDCLPQAKFDFLCVKASLFSSHDQRNTATIDFMVDSGSDVSTVQEDTLKKLNLELIGPVYSCGIHGGNHTNLYKGRLKVGDQELDIEVMGSNYDSLGSRVVRHFRHIIDGHQHIWLKGNYTDPLPAIVPIEFPPIVNMSHLTQNNGRQQAALSIESANELITESSKGNLEQSTRAPAVDNQGATSNTPSISIQSTFTNRDVPCTEQLQFVGAEQSDNHNQPLTPQALSIQEEIPQSTTFSNHCPPHSPTNIHQSSHYKYTALSNKGKRSMKSNSYYLIKSSRKRKYSRTGLPKESLQGHSCFSNEKSQSLLVKSQSGNANSSDSLEEQPAQSDANMHSNERVSLCNILPVSLRDTDDDVDHLESPVIVSEASTLKQKHEIYKCFASTKDGFNLRPHALNGTLDTFSSASCGQIASTNFSDHKNHNDLTNNMFDVVHIDGLHVENMEYDDDDYNIYSGGDSSIESGRDERKIAMNFIPASDEIKEILLEETVHDVSVALT